MNAFWILLAIFVPASIFGVWYNMRYQFEERLRVKLKEYRQLHVFECESCGESLWIEQPKPFEQTLCKSCKRQLQHRELAA